MSEQYGQQSHQRPHHGRGQNKAEKDATEAEETPADAPVTVRPEDRPGVIGEVSREFDRVRDDVSEIRDRVTSLHEKLVQDRAENFTPDHGDVVLKREREGTIASQGHIDILAMVKTKLTEVEGVIRGATWPANPDVPRGA